jgi:glycosyltransferase involved in cell wall biosynthesis
VSSLEGITLNSGIGTFYSSLAELLTSMDNQVTILFTEPSDDARFQSAVEHYRNHKIQLTSLPVVPATKIDAAEMGKKSFEVYQFLKKTEFDLIHFPEWEGIGYYSLLSKKDGLHFLSTVLVVGLHGPTHWVYSGNTGKETLVSERELEIDYMERKSAELADSVWTPSEEIYQWAINHGWKMATPVMLPLIPGKEIKSLSHQTAARQAKELVFFGRLESRKGLTLFCDALDQLSSKDILVTFLGTESVGTIDGLQAVEYIESRASNWGFYWKVIVDSNRMAALQYLLESDNRVAVIPSLLDNSPNTVYECLYLGVPFVATNIPSIASLVHDDYKAYLVEPNVDALSHALNRAIQEGVLASVGVWNVEKVEQVWASYYESLFSHAKDVDEVQQDNKPLVSICVVHFNRPNLLLQAIESIESQTYQNIEVVLVDDGSSMPEAVSLLEHLEAPFSARGWKIIKSTNKYLGAARNIAAKAAKGEYLLFLDDDNLLTPETVSTYVKVAQRTKATLLTAAHSVFNSVEPPTEVTVPERIWVPLGSSPAVGLFRNCFGDANFFVNKERFLSQLFTEESSVGFEDYEFHATAALNGWETVVIPESLLWYRMHDDDQMILSTNSLLNRLRSLRPYGSKLNDFTPLMRFLASGEVVQRATTCGDMICNTTGGENCLNCYEDCNSICKCPGDPVSRCSGNGACRLTNDNGRTKAYCDCRRNYFCCDCRLNANKNPGKIQVATIDKKNTDNVLDFKLSESKKGVSIAVAKGTFSYPVTVCFQEYTGKNLDTYPQPFVDPDVVLPDDKADAVFPSGGFFLDFTDTDTNVPQGDSLKKPIAIEWNQPEQDKNNVKSITPFLWDDFTEEWILPAETIKNEDLAFVRHGTSKVTFSVGSMPACGGQFQMYATEKRVSRTSGGGSRPSSRVSRTSGGSRSTSTGSRGSRTSGSRPKTKTPPVLSGSGTFTVSLPPTPTSVVNFTETSTALPTSATETVPSTTTRTPTKSKTPSRSPSAVSRTSGRGPVSRTSGGGAVSRKTASASVSSASSLLFSSWAIVVVSIISFLFF